MKDTQQPGQVVLATLIEWLRDGRFVIPDFQRNFEWDTSDIRELMRSIFLDYYIGNLLLWEGTNENFDTLSCIPIAGFEGNDHREHIVLDGQQRLTAIYYSFFAPDIPPPRRKKRVLYYIRVDHFMAEEYDKAFQYESLVNRIVRMQEDRDWQFREHIFPLYIIGDEDRFSLPNWLQGYKNHWEQAGDSQQAENAQQFGIYIQDLIRKYQISYIELDQKVALGKVCEIFTKINSQGISLDTFDLMNAMLSPKQLKLRAMYEQAAPRLAAFSGDDRLNIRILQVMSLKMQEACSPRYLYYLVPKSEKQTRDSRGKRQTVVLVPDSEAFVELWEDAVTALEGTTQLLRDPREFGAVAESYLPYTTILPAFAVLQMHAKSLAPAQRIKAYHKIQLWYWASVFLNRYKSAVDSTSASDYRNVRNWIGADSQEPDFVSDFKTSIQSFDLKRETRGGNSTYRGIFNLMIKAGPLDWIEGSMLQPDNMDNHHIIPVSWGNKNLERGFVHTILNRTPLSAETNREVIRDRLPNEYLPELIESAGEEKFSSIMESHFISGDALDILLRTPFTKDDFDDFVTERQRMILDGIENLLVKERLELPLNLQRLQNGVKSVEMKLRELILETLDGNAELIPQHIDRKAKERIQRDVHKNPMNEERYDKLANILEYFDLMELHQLMASKALWSRFQGIWGSKQNLEIKFGQLSELRNALSHSRQLGDVTRKEGEAAISWFGQVLKLPDLL